MDPKNISSKSIEVGARNKKISVSPLDIDNHEVRSDSPKAKHRAQRGLELWFLLLHGEAGREAGGK